MRSRFALWAIWAFVSLFLMWLDAPWLYLIAVFVVSWIIERWILRWKPVERRQILPNRRLLTAIICGALGAAAGVGMGFFMQSDATTLVWLGILPGAVGFFFGLVFKMTA